jgi:hypothetical protein
MKIEIVSNEIREQSGVAQKTGKPYHIRKQQAFAHIEGVKYPVAFTLNVPNDRKPYEPGMYQLVETNFYVDRFGALGLSQELVLTPVRAV